MAGSSNAPYKWTTHKIALTYIAAHSVTNGGKDDILKEDNIANVVRLLNEKSHFARAMVTDTDVRNFFEEQRAIYRRICELCDLPYVIGFSRSSHRVMMRMDYIEGHIKVFDLVSVIHTCQLIHLSYVQLFDVGISG